MSHHAASNKRWEEAHKEERRAYKRAWYQTQKGKESNRRARRRYNLSKYGLTEELYDALLQKQGGKCALCSRPPGKTRLHVDHCHKTGRVRGLLCFHCNKSIGVLGDTEESLRRVVEYLTAP